ncbi:hypothetical protein NPA31_018870 [Aurantimonas sp. MSK8Z-1]|uniref:hypothetical protein n=1 Tax=Mangrovibrevibacter kandeliae TaxID=2968473 RepID=UPI002118CCD5|nr:hypothetical protein [Aurantimonas sp. MSK8Z-1]MCW4117027.1 hypothetical protein [Aurantimonas sp. MSK8Z-1]
MTLDDELETAAAMVIRAHYRKCLGSDPDAGCSLEEVEATIRMRGGGDALDADIEDIADEVGWWRGLDVEAWIERRLEERRPAPRM